MTLLNIFSLNFVPVTRLKEGLSPQAFSTLGLQGKRLLFTFQKMSFLPSDCRSARSQRMRRRFKIMLPFFAKYENFYRPIPFEDVLTILVSIFIVLRDERKGRECDCLTWWKKGRWMLLIKTESVYRNSMIGKLFFQFPL